MHKIYSTATVRVQTPLLNTLRDWNQIPLAKMYVKAWDSFERGGYIEAFVIILTAALVVKYALNMIFDPLRSIPGPWSTRFTRLWELHALRKGDFPSAHLELHRRYGSTPFCAHCPMIICLPA